MLKVTLAFMLSVWLLALAGAQSPDDEEGGFESNEDLLSTRLPDGRFVLVCVDIDSETGYQCIVFAPDGKKQKLIDAEKMWMGEFIPRVVCGIDNNHVVVLGDAQKHSREARVFDLVTGKMSGILTMPLGHVRTLEWLADGALLAHDWGILEAVSPSGKPLWKRDSIPGPNGTTTSMARVDAVRVMPGGGICALEEQDNRVVILDRDLKFVREISLKQLDKFWPTQEVGSAKDGVWLQDSTDGRLVKIGLDGRILTKISVPTFSDGSEHTWIHFLGTTASGAPVFDWDWLFWVGPDGKAMGFNGKKID